MTTKAVFPGTFDPMTKGHTSVIRKAARLFDEVTVLIAKNEGKKTPLFTEAERKALAEIVFKDYLNVKVALMQDEYVPDYAVENGIGFIIRSTRNIVDFAYEDIIRQAYNNIQKEPEIVQMMPSKEFEHVSSSLVKELVGEHGIKGWETQVREYLDTPVFLQFLAKNTEKLGIKKIWHQTLSRLGADSEAANAAFSKLLERYSELHRAHHTIYHLVEIFEEAEKHGLCLPPQLVLSLFFHDSIHNIGSNDNEERSARYACEMLSEMGAGGIAKETSRLVLETDYEKIKHPSYELSALQRDLDFSVLAKDRKRVLEYDDEIRLEYSKVFSDSVLKRGRARFLLGLTKSDIFHSSSFKPLEAVAKKNAHALLVERYFDIIEVSAGYRNKTLAVPESMRGELKKPAGELFARLEDLLAKYGKMKIIAVGDTVTCSILEKGIKPFLCVYDFKTRKNKLDERRKRAICDAYPSFSEIENPAGTITEALETELERRAGTDGGAIFVKGEEDLAALVLMRASPANAVIVYGQPGEGVVAVPCNKENKRLAEELLAKMDEFMQRRQ
jgi:pantetheine-phosphate adenylyltransferase